MQEMTESMRAAMSLDGDPSRLAEFYSNWASTYDEDVGGHEYGLPGAMVATLMAAAGVDRTTAWAADRNITIFDAGCGTGLVGAALAQAGYRTIDGVDVSTEMIEIAQERGIYRRLEGNVDLLNPPPWLVGAADVVTIGGVFTVGHVPPETLGVVAGIARHGGILVASVRKAYLEQTDYLEVSNNLIERGVLEVLVHAPDQPYTMDSTGDYWAYRVR